MFAYRFSYLSSTGITEQQKLLAQLVGDVIVDLFVFSDQEIDPKSTWAFIKQRPDCLRVSSYDQVDYNRAIKAHDALKIFYSPAC